MWLLEPHLYDLLYVGTIKLNLADVYISFQFCCNSVPRSESHEENVALFLGVTAL